MISVSSVCTSKFHIFFSRSPREWGHLINVSVLRYLSKFCASLCFCNQPPPPSPALNALRTNEKPFRQYLLFFAVFFLVNNSGWPSPRGGLIQKMSQKDTRISKNLRKGIVPFSTCHLLSYELLEQLGWKRFLHS